MVATVSQHSSTARLCPAAGLPPRINDVTGDMKTVVPADLHRQAISRDSYQPGARIGLMRAPYFMRLAKTVVPLYTLSNPMN